MTTLKALISLRRDINSMGKRCYIMKTTSSSGVVSIKSYDFVVDAVEALRDYLIGSSDFLPSIHDGIDIVITKDFKH